jgi:hypothetical protein
MLSQGTFFSTSSSTTSYLWEDHAIENATAEFIRNGGKMKRIIIYHPLDLSYL